MQKILQANWDAIREHVQDDGTVEIIFREFLKKAELRFISEFSDNKQKVESAWASPWIRGPVVQRRIHVFLS